MVNLTKNFSLEELIYSVTADANKISNVPSKDEINNLRLLCANVLQPLRDHFKTSVIVTSGYRSSGLNRKIGGAKNSQHLLGQAADIVMPAQKLTDVFNYIKNNLEYDQLLLEYNTHGDRWIHVSFNYGHNRKMFIENYKA